jgi:PAS domain S-box-containing protein
MMENPVENGIPAKDNEEIINFIKIFDTYLGESTSGFCFVDSTFTIVYANKMMEEITGYPKDAITGKKVSEFISSPSEEIQKIISLYTNGRQKTNQTMIFEFDMITRANVHKWAEITIIPAEQKETLNLIGYIVNIIDKSELKKIQEELKFSSAAFKSIQEGIIANDTEMNITVWNEASERIYGVKASDAIGKKVFDVVKIINPSGRELQEELDSMLVNRYSQFVHLVNTNRGELWTNVFSQTIRDDNGKEIGRLSIITDITEKKKIEEKLRLNDAGFKAIKEGVIITDLESNIIYFNEASEKLYNIKISEVIGKKLFDIIEIIKPSPDDLKKEFEALLIFEHTNSEHLVKIKNMELWVEVSSQIIKNESEERIAVLSIITDITKRKEMEEALAEEISRRQKLFEQTPVGIVILDPSTAHFKYFNNIACRQLGYSREEFATLTVMDIEAKETAAETKDAIARILKEGRSDFETLQRTKQGEIRNVHVIAQLVNIAGENVYQCVWQDITDLKQAEEREKQMRQELNITSRLASIGEMASGIAHEINNPLTGIIGFSQLLIDEMPGNCPSNMKEDIKIIHQEAERVAKIVSGLLSFARQRKPGWSVIDINQIILETLELRLYSMEMNDIKVTTELFEPLPKTTGDSGQIKQVFMNIILNAEQVLGDIKNGKLIIKTESINDIIRISFTDNGPGISKENMDKIFNPFFTTKEVGQGTGLGLSICHGIITQHNGKIFAKSEPGKGATFVIELPLKTENIAAQEKIMDTIDNFPNAKKIKGLVVDDEKIILIFLNRLLSEWGYEVETVDRAIKAIEKIKINDYDFILLDIKMPEINGIRLYRLIEEINPSLVKKIIFATGDVLEKSTNAFFQETKAPTITKPIDTEKLKEVINEILGRNRLSSTFQSIF